MTARLAGGAAQRVGAAKRRRGRQLRAFHRHEVLSVRCRQDPAPQGAAVAVSLLLPLVLVNGTDHDGATVRFLLSTSLLRSKEEKRKKEKEEKLEALERDEEQEEEEVADVFLWFLLLCSRCSLLEILTFFSELPCLAALVRCLRLACGALGLPGLTVDTCTHVSPGGFSSMFVIFYETVDLGFCDCFL